MEVEATVKDTEQLQQSADINRPIILKHRRMQLCLTYYSVTTNQTNNCQDVFCIKLYAWTWQQKKGNL